MRRIMVDEMDGMDFGMWVQQSLNADKIIWQHRQNWVRVHKHK